MKSEWHKHRIALELRNGNREWAELLFFLFQEELKRTDYCNRMWMRLHLPCMLASLTLAGIPEAEVFFQGLLRSEAKAKDLFATRSMYYAVCHDWKEFDRMLVELSGLERMAKITIYNHSCAPQALCEAGYYDLALAFWETCKPWNSLLDLQDLYQWGSLRAMLYMAIMVLDQGLIHYFAKAADMARKAGRPDVAAWFC